MNVLATILIALATGTLPSAAVAGFFMFKVNRATAVKVLAEARDVSHKTSLAEAEKLVEFNNQRFQALKESCDSCLSKLERMEARDARRDRIEDALIDAVIEAIPLLPANADQTRAIRAAVAAARQAKYELDDT